MAKLNVLCAWKYPDPELSTYVNQAEVTIFARLVSTSKTCPQCRSVYDQPARRNGAVEDILEEWEYPCIYNDNGCSTKAKLADVDDHEKTCRYGIVECKLSGCSFKVMRSEINRHELNCVHRMKDCKFNVDGCHFHDKQKNMSDHEEACEFRKIYCPGGNCDDRVKFKDWQAHLKSKHANYAIFKDNTSSVDDRGWNLKESDLTHEVNIWAVAYWKFNDDYFIKRFQKVDGVFYAWLFIAASPKTAANYSCEISVKANDGHEFIYKGPIHTIDVHRKSIIENGRALVLMNGQVRASWNLRNEDDVLSKEGYDHKLKVIYKIIKKT